MFKTKFPKRTRTLKSSNKVMASPPFRGIPDHLQKLPKYLHAIIIHYKLPKIKANIPIRHRYHEMGEVFFAIAMKLYEALRIIIFLCA